MQRYIMSKLSNLATTITLPLMAFAAIGYIDSPVKAANAVTVACNNNNAVPTVTATLAASDRSVDEPYQTSQTTEILTFLPEYFAPEIASAECQKTAKLLQGYYSQNQMNYLASDTIDGKPVVCAVVRRGVSCDSYQSETLFSLNHTVNPTQLLYDMLGDDFKDSQVPASRTVSRIYTDLRPSWWPFERLFSK